MAVLGGLVASKAPAPCAQWPCVGCAWRCCGLVLLAGWRCWLISDAARNAPSPFLSSIQRPEGSMCAGERNGRGQRAVLADGL